MDTTLPMIGSMTTHMTFTLDRFEERGSATIAIISNLGTTEMTTDQNSPMAGMMELGNAASIGTIEFDVDRGLLVKSTGSTTMEMTLTMGGQEQVVGTIANIMMELVEGRP